MAISRVLALLFSKVSFLEMGEFPYYFRDLVHLIFNFGHLRLLLLLLVADESERRKQTVQLVRII